MNGLQHELERLYGLRTGSDGRPGGVAQDARVLVLALVRPSDWTQLAAVWRGVQSDLELPAPAIAVSGGDALQLWFALAAPLPPAVGARFLEGLRRRYLADVRATHVRLVTGADGWPATPPVEVHPDQWSAFVTPDLASLFADTPWLDVAPGDEGQATLLRALQPIGEAAFATALGQLEAADRPPSATSGVATAPPGATRIGIDPLRFLEGVLNDEAAPLALRIEAAKALLPYAGC